MGIPYDSSINAYTASLQCGSINPIFSYQGLNGTTGNALDPLNDFASVNPVTGAISLNDKSRLGNFTIKVVGMLQNSQSITEIFTLESENLPAEFNVK
jgi:hypothetical protein